MAASSATMIWTTVPSQSAANPGTAQKNVSLFRIGIAVVKLIRPSVLRVMMNSGQEPASKPGMKIAVVSNGVRTTRPRMPPRTESRSSTSVAWSTTNSRPASEAFAASSRQACASDAIATCSRKSRLSAWEPRTTLRRSGFTSALRASLRLAGRPGERVIPMLSTRLIGRAVVGPAAFAPGAVRHSEGEPPAPLHGGRSTCRRGRQAPMPLATSSLRGAGRKRQAIRPISDTLRKCSGGSWGSSLQEAPSSR